MFNDISPKYDLLNRLLSFGLDILWRKKINTYLVMQNRQKVLDIATGTADVLLNLFKANPHIHSAVGIDLADKMLEIGRKKIAKHNLDRLITLRHADANQVPFQNNTFDVTTMAFGIRNVEDPVRVLREMYRVLTIGGRAVILEFSLPENPIVRNLHLFYLRHIVPLIGGLFTGQFKAYRYLNQTIENFPYGYDFCTLMEQSGFENVVSHPLLFGVATIYRGDKIL